MEDSLQPLNSLQANETVYVIGPTPQSAKDLARYVEMSPEWFRWISSPRDLDGLDEPLVAIMPNWWVRNSYSGMEQQLTDVNARIFNVHFGPFKPNWRGQRQLTRSDFIAEAKSRQLRAKKEQASPGDAGVRPSSDGTEDEGDEEHG